MSLREKVCLMNMCVVKDEAGNVVVLDKVGKSYTGLTFPGGHVEKGENLSASVIREVREETGLVIENPHLEGIYHWNEDDIHNVGFIYTARYMGGELVSSEEGKVSWIPFEELKTMKVARGTEFVLKMIEDSSISECYVELTEDGYRGTLY